ncbi:MAG: histidine--tRNA ligase family protein, partial [Candidatus Zixiibacteriota bacterium]
MAKEKKVKRVKPQLLKGFRDYSPAEQIAREEMLGKLRDAVELMGFLPLQTASLEFAETLLGPHYTSDNLQELFGFTGPDEVDMALRYEFTVSLARYVAAHPQLPLPFRRYQYGTVWRVDKPGPGRYREFMQFDIDIVGTRNLLADAEIIATMVRVFQALGIERFVVGYSNRKILNGLVEWAGIPAERGPDVMRVLDKLERIEEAGVLQELGEGRVDESGDTIEGLHLPQEQISRIKDFIHTIHFAGHAPAEREQRLKAAKELLAGVDAAVEGFLELEQIRAYLVNMNVPEDKVEENLTIVRGLGYYTG